MADNKDINDHHLLFARVL